MSAQPSFTRILMTYSALEESAARFITQVFQSPHWPNYPYHNLEHTIAVVEHAKMIGEFYALSEENLCVISVAAWFHDAGQLSGDMKDHEERSAAMMENFFGAAGIPPTFIQEVKDCIMATKLGSQPQTQNEKIICDADTWHFGTLYFHKTEFLVQKEMEIRTGHGFANWHQKSLQLLKSHVYFTEYCQLHLNKGKQDNIEWLKTLIQSPE